MSEKSTLRRDLQKAFADPSADFESILEENSPVALADALAEIIIQLNENKIPPDEPLISRLFDSAFKVHSELLRTVSTGTLWREDLQWLSAKTQAGESCSELLLKTITADKPEALSRNFWKAVAEKGASYIAIAFDATKDAYPGEAARLLVGLCQETVAERWEMDIRNVVDGFLNRHDSSVRTAFLDRMKKISQLEKKKIMTHLDMSLMAELDESSIEEKGKSFFYDEVAEKEKRESKSKDIFAEVARRLEKGEKPL